MKVLVLGATGLSGREVVDRSLSYGYETTAFVRDASKLDPYRDRLTVVEGDISDYTAVRQAVEKQGGVISALGAPNLRPNPAITQGIRNVVRAMEEQGVRRLVYESALGVGDSRQRVGALFRTVVGGVILRNAFADHEEKEEIIRASSLEWVIVRPGDLTRGPPRGNYRTGVDLRDRFPRGQVSRADVARFMLDQLTDERYLCSAPAMLY